MSFRREAISVGILIAISLFILFLFPWVLFAGLPLEVKLIISLIILGTTLPVYVGMGIIIYFVDN